MPNSTGGNESGKEISRRSVLIGGAVMVATAAVHLATSFSVADQACFKL